MVREVGKKWRKVKMHSTLFSLLFAVLCQALKKNSVASTYGGPGCVMSCKLDWLQGN